jgi:hypothetical protein
MSDTAHKDENPKVVLERLRKRVLGGSNLLLDSLTDEETNCDAGTDLQR